MKELRQLKDFSVPHEQVGKLCFLEHPNAVDEGNEEIYVICEMIQDDVAYLCILDSPNNPYIEVNYTKENVFIMDAACVVNRVTEWK